MKVEMKKRLLKWGAHLVRIGSDAAEILVQVKGSTGLVAGTTVGLALTSRILNTYRDLTEQQLSTFFRDWMSFDVHPFSDLLHDLCLAEGMLVERDTTVDRASKVVTADLNGISIGWINHSQWRAGPWVTAPAEFDVDEARDKVAQFIWSCIGNNLCLQRPPLSSLRVVSDNLVTVLPSDTAEQVYARLEAFLTAGFHRSMLLYGEPGTGKSHVLRHVAKRAGGRSLRIKARELEGLQDVARAVRLLRPSIVLIDDLDRASDSAGVLTVFEEVKATARLLMATVNDLSELDEALLRPGRFDDVVEITTLDGGVLQRLLEGVPDKAAARLRTMPVAYIDEFHKLRAAFGLEKALEEVEQLRNRLEVVRTLAKTRKVAKEKDEKDEADVPCGT